MRKEKIENGKDTNRTDPPDKRVWSELSNSSYVNMTWHPGKVR